MKSVLGTGEAISQRVPSPKEICSFYEWVKMFSGFLIKTDFERFLASVQMNAATSSQALLDAFTLCSITFFQAEHFLEQLFCITDVAWPGLDLYAEPELFSENSCTSEVTLLTFIWVDMVQCEYKWLYIAPSSDILPAELAALILVNHHREEGKIHYEETCERLNFFLLSFWLNGGHNVAEETLKMQLYVLC